MRELHQAKPNDNQPSNMGVSASATLSTSVSDSAQSGEPARKKHKANPFDWFQTPSASSLTAR